MNKVKRGLGTHPKGDDIAVVMAIFVVERRRLVLDGDILAASRDECCGWCMAAERVGHRAVDRPAGFGVDQGKDFRKRSVLGQVLMQACQILRRRIHVGDPSKPIGGDQSLATLFRTESSQSRCSFIRTSVRCLYRATEIVVLTTSSPNGLGR